MMNKQVRHIMTTDPIVVGPNQSVEEVSDMMVNERIQQIPVVNEGKLVGMVTSYDLWKNTRQANAVQGKKIEDVMTTNVLKITPIDKVGTAAELFADQRFKTLPVVNLRNELKGVVTAFDVIRQAFNEEYEQAILYKKEFKDPLLQ